ncbi:MAG: FMN-binding protein, partial [Pseudonocardia sp.]|nr:FMN-binding protein [Pseudonocardia sp.]
GTTAGATATFRDGTYVGRSAADDSGGYGEVRITLRGNDIVATEYRMLQAGGTAKDENYGKRNGEIVNAEFYAKAQTAVAAGPRYAAQLVAVDDPGDVDLVSGATISHRQFAEAVEKALDQARE